MKDIINLAVVNFKTVWGDKSANLDKMVNFIKEGSEKSVDLIVFPETCLTGYVNDKEPVREKKMHARLAETLNGESVKVISELSKKFNKNYKFSIFCKNLFNDLYQVYIPNFLLEYFSNSSFV